MPSFKKFEKKLEGATRGQSFVWEVYGILWPNLAPYVFGKLAVNSQCGFFTIGVLACFKNSSERIIEISLTDFEIASVIWKSFHVMQCIYQNSQNRPLTVN